MKDKFVFDFRDILDEIFEASENFQDEMKKRFHRGPNAFWKNWDDNVDFYPAHSYPPANVYMDKDKTLYFEFAVAGFSENAINLQFVGDYMVLNITAPEPEEGKDDIRYFKKRLKMKAVQDQKYYVPADRFDQEKVKAVYKSGLLKVAIPARETVETKDGVKIEIVKEEV
ncbi:MAG: Hsp20/alpha crystallin family protein [Spirochaetales bacterium]|nr:Hsp20/alpha crystallin family protein [Spirochaetales bacterium]